LILRICSDRLELRAATLELAESELGDRVELARALDAAVPAEWPPESLADALPVFRDLLRSHPDWHGWLGWYGVLTEGERVLAGSIGFKGPPGVDGMVEVGYSVLPRFQGRGLATEMLRTLLAWALRQPAVSIVEAETYPGNLASRRVLAKAGFAPIGTGLEPGTIRFRHWGE